MLNKLKRRETLIAHGVPLPFLDILDDAEGFLGSELLALKPESIYLYLGENDLFLTYEFLRDCTITPVFESANRDDYCVLLQESDSHRFIRFTLECHEPITDYGQNFMVAITELLIFIYEQEDDKNLDQLTTIGLALGFQKSKAFFSELFATEEERSGYRYEQYKNWETKFIEKFV